MTLREDQIRRYARHILLPDVGGVGQERLLSGAVRVEIGPGCAAGAAALAYLAAAGVGEVILAGDVHGSVTADEVTSGILYGGDDVGRPRVDAVRARIAALNPDVTVVVDSGDPGALEIDPGPAEDDVAGALAAGGGAAVRALATLARERG